MDFSAYSVWSAIVLIAILLVSLLVASTLKRFIPFLRKSLIPSSVMGGIILLIISTIVYYTAGDYLFNVAAAEAGGAHRGMQVLEIITYHCLGIGFIAMSMRSSKRKLTKKRTGEIFNSGVVTVNTYLVQAIVGIVITLIATSVFHVAGMIDGAGIILCFGFGQGTGQALNYGNMFEKQEGEYFLEGGSNFGLTIAAMGFLVACIVGVIYLAVLRRKGIIKVTEKNEKTTLSDYEDENEIPHVDSMDKFTVQVAIVLFLYALSYVIMWGLSKLIPGMTTTLFGFNFLIGVLLTIPTKAIINALEKKKVIKKKIVNNFMMNRIGGIAFDLMIVAGVAAIQLPLLKDHWGVILLLSVIGGVATFFYVYYTSKILFPEYHHEQFLGMFGMLTGTASTGMILLREIDGSYRTPASENVVFQTLPAIVFGVPMMILAPMAGKSKAQCLIVFGVVIAYFLALNVLLFRDKIFRKRRTAKAAEEGASSEEEPVSEAQEGGAGEQPLEEVTAAEESVQTQEGSDTP